MPRLNHPFFARLFAATALGLLTPLAQATAQTAPAIPTIGQLALDEAVPGHGPDEPIMPAEEFETWYGEVSRDPPGLHLMKVKGCASCHSVDGTALVGRWFEGIYGKPVVVVSGDEERELTVDDEYLKRSILEPQAELVKGYPPSMPPQRALVNDFEISQIIDYIQSLQ